MRGVAGSSPPRVIPTTYRPCPWPTCDGYCPPNWHFCSRCQGDRLVARLCGVVNGRPVTEDERSLLVARDAHRDAQYKKWQQNSRQYRSAWRKTPVGIESRRREYVARMARISAIRDKFTRARDAQQVRNSERYRLEMEQIKREASYELRNLIADQERDNKQQVSRVKGDPWMMRSLDAPIPGHEDMTLGDLYSHDGGRWADPTGNIASMLADGDLSAA